MFTVMLLLLSAMLLEREGAVARGLLSSLLVVTGHALLATVLWCCAAIEALSSVLVSPASCGCHSLPVSVVSSCRERSAKKKKANIRGEAETPSAKEGTCEGRDQKHSAVWVVPFDMRAASGKREDHALSSRLTHFASMCMALRLHAS